MPLSEPSKNFLARSLPYALTARRKRFWSDSAARSAAALEHFILDLGKLIDVVDEIYEQELLRQ
ncbi:hypothetical protein IVB14_16485 [Bradyrhizobium sp. 180]|uniref:hypothetical protein n=1 Tax=Bradyrhizobium sp. 180 TaxID=2782650 RepID=UPI001FFBFE7F|nr:hypothetical protein [Bradyrhizobium sp. 180]MCK1491975.1 hypothetical protein [Bradyrhizobium sp. 180]